MKVFTVAYSMFKRSVNKRFSLVIYIISPIIAMLIPLLFFYDINENISIGIIDNDNSYISRQIIDELHNKEDLRISLLSKNDAEKDLVQNEVLAVINIPKNYSNDISDGYINKIELDFLQWNVDIETLKLELEMLISKIYSVAKNTENEKEFITVYNEIKYNDLHVNKKYINIQRLDQMVLGFIIMLLIIIYTNSFSTIIKDRNDKTYKKILLTGTSSNEYILGQLLWNSILLLIQIILLIGFVKLFNLKIGIPIYRFLYLLIFIGILAMSIGIFTISLCNTENQISVINTLIIFPSSMLSGSFWPLEIMNDKLQKLSFAFPQRYIFKLLQLFQSNSSSLEIILTIALIVLMSALIMYLGLVKINNTREDYL